ncbi:hypothetical protein [Dethiobacter alkaliphilus]|uniref:hypothetical protein n=1 Tax=Dethiobacter alkaliphilus TaxID=427926 RepID=UPI002226AEE1|nr:hypothetical protein [Dethiobacter alkaliphilus]MCW3490705.1 hypothetical protein [Dethiobacter alkaliphilus]
MSEHEIPWHEGDIFHDKLDAYPLQDYFPLEKKATEKKTADSKIEPYLKKTDWH